MEKYLLFLIFCLSMAWSHDIQAQVDVNTKEDSLSIFLERKDLVSYFRMITEMGDTASRYSDAESLFALSHLLQQDFGEINLLQHMALRLCATKMGQKIYKNFGNIDESLKLYLIAHKNVKNKITLDSLSWYIENQIMNLYTMKGEYEKAIYFGNLIEASLKQYHQYEYLSRYYVNLGLILKSEFKIDAAIGSFEKGYRLADSIKYNVGIFANTLNLAGVYNEHPELGSAESYLVKAGTLLHEIISDNRYLEKKASFEIETANFRCLKGEYRESIPLYQEAIQTLSQYYPNTGRREFAKYYTSLATAYVHMDSLQAARRIIKQGFACLIPEFTLEDNIPRISELYPENSFIDLLELEAEVYEMGSAGSTDYDNLQSAMACIELALDVNDQIRETVIADPSKLVTIRSNKEIIQKGITILFQLYTQDSSRGYFDQARSLFNRSKSLLYNDKTKRNNLNGTISLSDREKWAALQDSLFDLYEAKFDKPSEINIINGKILACQEKINEIFSAYNNKLPVTKTLDQYIEYFKADDFIYSLSQLNGRQKFVRHGTIAEFQKLADRLNEFIKEKAMSLDGVVVNDLYNYLISPVTEGLPDHVVIVPDGSIGYVPFEMLKDKRGKYLLEVSTISYSFEYMTYVNEQDNIHKPFEVYCLAPQYKTKEEEETVPSRGNMIDLPYARMEVDSICKLYGASAKTSQSSDKNDLDQKLSQTHIFHYAGHAIIQNDKAYLALNDSGIEKQQLTASEIGLKHHTLDLVVLSACETGLGKMELGEGIRSLGRSFMESGANSTVISLWNVNDKSTAVIMTSFYKYLKMGLRKDEALRKAKLDFMNNTKSNFAHPYFWAAFIPAGDMSALSNP
ncbi:MAG: CHAT domain-containing protein [Saprospiraceae bacterium]